MSASTVHSDFEDLCLDIFDGVKNVEGWQSDRELEMLALLGAYPTADGVVLEIGSHRGRSTIALAKGARFAGEPAIIAVDPLPDSVEMVPDRHSKLSARAALDSNLAGAGIKDGVEFHQLLSSELAGTWDRPIRLLWIDAEHTYPAAKADYEHFYPHLSDGAIVALDDVISNYFDGPVRVFSEILLSPNFGPSGLVGSIGWAQYFRNPQQAARYRHHNARLFARLNRLVWLPAISDKPNWLQRRLFRLILLQIPNRRFEAARWIGGMQAAGHADASMPVKTKN
ncbi:class I SAM-dependent methyltransferase [Hoeflea sp.]|uniref:class I SAM-dependent methyltransferase n=1 Tax=Hoeflea sp. TaxID=1940281 RepID=UPI003B01319C